MLKKLAKVESASWAIWSDTFGTPDCVESNLENIYNFMVRKQKHMKRNIIFMGLNRSGGKSVKNYCANYSSSPPFHNFHLPDKKGDRKLFELIQKNKLQNLQGGFMTDINTRQVDSLSANVIVSGSDEEILFKQLSVLDNYAYTIICFGDKSFNSLLRLIGCKLSEVKDISHNIKRVITNYKNKRLDVFRVWHYSNYGKNIHKLEELSVQLKHINEFCGEVREM